MAARSLPLETVWDLYAAVPSQLRAEVVNGTLHVEMAVYAREGIPFVWLVDPLARNVRAFRVEGAAFVAAGEPSREGRLPPFEEAALDFDALWPD